MAEFDKTDARILDTIQQSFPLVAEPFAEISSGLGIPTADVIDRITALKKSGVLRQLSAIFDTRRLGYKSSLVAMGIEPSRIEHVAQIINAHPGVSHNYEREGAFNLWFTIAVPPGSNLKSELAKFEGIEGIKTVRMLPTIKLFKIGVKLEIVESDKKKVAPSEQKPKVSAVDFVPTEYDKEFIREMQKDLEITERPFEAPAQRLNMTQDRLFSELLRYQEIGVMRRFAAILRHRDAGFAANGMIVWKVPEPRIEEVGQMLGAFPQVSHCYQRPTYEDWPYNVFSMIHTRTRQEADEVVRQIQSQINVDEYRVLFSLREFKKTRVEYFVEQNFEIAKTPSVSA